MAKPEYEILREEILFYLEKHQAVRNMMYIVTGTLLALVTKFDNPSAYFYLLPLIVIIASYVISYDYLDNVLRAATYLMVFYEDREVSDYHWETRIRKFNANEHHFLKIHRMPYEICSIACMALYILNNKGNAVVCSVVSCMCLGICCFVFTKYKEVNEKKYITDWQEIKQSELHES